MGAKKILLVGGAGYVGSVTCEMLVERGYDVYVLDNLYQGFAEAVNPAATFVRGSMEDSELLARLFKAYDFYGVMDFAGETLIEYSMTDPYRYFKANIEDGLKLLNAMVEHGVTRLIFSSTSAVYGEALEIPMREEHPKDPANSYGDSKLIFETILKWYYRIHGLRSISFRYFNASGASTNCGEAHHPETHLIPVLLEVARGMRERFYVFGGDYDTKDGTCIRDYTHVIDIANAHILGIENIDAIEHDAFNLGNGSGYTVREVLDAALRVTGRGIPFEVTERRAGDAAVMIASSEKARRVLGWEPEYPAIDDIIRTAWEWHQSHPNGYEAHKRT